MESFVLKMGESIRDDRFFYYGVSIILIILYHANCFGYHATCFTPFSAGYIGVDVFMFFSAYGCSYSFEKNNLLDFYKRRFKRIFPIYLIFVVIVSSFYVSGGGNLSFFDGISNVLLLWFFGVGGIYVEWYMTSILLLYMVFPIFYYIACKTRFYGFVILILLCVLLLVYGSFEWWQMALIGRLPMYYCGCLFFYYHNKQTEVKLSRFFMRLLIVVSTCLGIVLANHIQGFISVDMFGPILIIMIYIMTLIVSQFNMRRIRSFIIYCGEHSFQIFAANALTLIILNHLTLGFYYSYLLYFSLTLLLTPFFIYYDKVANMVLK